jgi:hypothetical protein
MTGKGLAFLNKKGWHVSTMQNQERVWKREQEVLAEQKKIAELKREKAEEAKIEELRQLNEAASGVKRAKRVDFLYEQPMQRASAEDYLLGKKIDDLLLQDAKAQQQTALATGGAAAAATGGSAGSGGAAGAANVPGSLWLGDALDPTVDTAAKIRDDPMFAIKERERDALKKLLSNPVQLKKLRADVASSKRDKKHKKDRKERDRSDDDRDRRHSRRHRSSSKHRSSKHRSSSDRSSTKRKHRGDRSESSSSSSSSSTRSSSSSESSRRRSRERPPGGGIVYGGGGKRLSDNDAIAAVNPNYQHYKKLAEERSKLDTFQRAPRQELTAAEREERRQAMQRDAEAHEADRVKRARKSREEDEKERAELLARSAPEATLSGPKFVSDMRQQAYAVDK